MELTHDDLIQIAALIAQEIKPHLTPDILGRWLTLDEASKYAKKGPRTIVKWIKKGLIYGKTRSGKGDWIVDRESIDKWYNNERYTM